MGSRFRDCVVGLFVLFALLPLAVHGTDYFVRASGRDDSNGRSAVTAFATLKHAAVVAQSGDTVYVGGGLYTDAVTVLGVKQSAQPLQFVADTQGTERATAARW